MSTVILLSMTKGRQFTNNQS